MLCYHWKVLSIIIPLDNGSQLIPPLSVSCSEPWDGYWYGHCITKGVSLAMSDVHPGKSMQNS